MVDDHRESALSLAMVLEAMGHEARVAFDGPNAVAAAERFRPEVIFLDLALPKLNGYDTCRRIREQSWGSDVVIIALTGWGREEDKQRSREAGFTLHLVKPLDPDALERVLAAALPTKR